MTDTEKPGADWSEAATNLASESAAALEILSPTVLTPAVPDQSSESDPALSDPKEMGANESRETGDDDDDLDKQLETLDISGSDEDFLPEQSRSGAKDQTYDLDATPKSTVSKGVQLEKQRSSTKNKKEQKNAKKLDQYGFITNLDNKGQLRDDEFHGIPGGAMTPTVSQQRPKKKKQISKREIKMRKKWQLRREKKWNDMLDNWDSIIKSTQKYKKMRSRVRKGIPNSCRGRAWSAIAKADFMAKKGEVGVYQDLVDRTCGHEDDESDSEDDSAKNWYDGNHVPADLAKKVTPKVDSGSSVMKDTIERDINRTFPRHSMFYVSDSDSDTENNSDDPSFDNWSMDTGSIQTNEGEFNPHYQEHDEVEIDASGAVVPCWAKGVIDKVSSSCAGDKKGTHDGEPFLDMPAVIHPKKNKKKKDEPDLTVAEGGQASLRRVLRAYSIYDSEVGYCQGMNFIAAMFITYMSEEEAFWVLATSMNKPPCQMRGLFGEGMSEAHQVLFVADKLIGQFLPRLSKHLRRENIDITMFATQWLLTIYTSSFPFEIVTRVWDCFLVEGWKVAYRVMLALLDAASSTLMKLRFEDILGYLKELPNNIDCDALLNYAFKIPLKHRHIEKYAKQWEKQQKKR